MSIFVTILVVVGSSIAVGALLLGFALLSIGNAVTGSIDATLTDVGIEQAAERHAFAEGAEYRWPQNEPEQIEFLLKHCRENRYWAPHEHDFMDDFLFHLEDSYEHHPWRFEK